VVDGSIGSKSPSEPLGHGAGMPPLAESASGTVAPPSAAADRSGGNDAAVDRTPAAPEPGKSPPTRPEPTEDVDAGRTAERLALARLDTLIATLHPDVITEEAARRAAAGLGALLPALRTAHDSVRADLNRANAYFFLQRIPEACVVLESARARATPTTRVQIDVQIETLGCR
jgi:hypothetical protein